MIRFRSALLVLTALGILALSQTGHSQTEGKRSKSQGKEAKESEEIDIEGYYICKGIDNLKSYNGVTVITRKDEIYVVQWMVGQGAGFFGVGVRQGSTLAVSWAIPGDVKGVIRGVNLYHIEKGPRLVGDWASLPGRGTINRETLTFLKRMEPE